jgi:hypothetical protein
MTHFVNCSHNDSGWCIQCVRELWEEKEELDRRLDLSIQDREYKKQLIKKYETRFDKMREIIDEWGI